ncbi:family 8 carbohydrate esterase [Dactylonectria estremocensis]|uniref:Pectinesterase n=1 Tax=Dactylonectria estremocensis TaxID=1079267 RepID=A0A9P9DRX8_9HYPO|nr:family 8 carbohydrate esterase [Dactylonectria estremocensis]
MKAISAILSFLPAALAVSSAPSGCITVAKSGGNYATIQAAVNSLSTTSTAAQCIFIKAGTYKEQVLVSARSAQLTIYGATTTDSTYKSNTVTISSGLSQADGLSNDATGTLRVKATGFRLYNVDVENTYGEGSQAVALSAYADSGYYGSSFIGFQDTVLSNTGKQIYVGCKIEGATDFIFGQVAYSWFERVDIRVLGRKIGYVTANGPTAAGNSYYVFNKCDIAAADGETVPTGAYYLGRPWREYAKVVFQYTSMSSVINSAGWSIWNTGDPRTGSVLFGEYQNNGSGASGTRATFATKLSSPILIKDILGSSYASQPYFDSDYYNGA